MSEDLPPLREPYSTRDQQREADMLGIYLFLASEIMLFGGLFAVAFVAHFLHPEGFVEASKKMHVFIGAANTMILLTSSYLVAIAVRAARAGHARLVSGCLALAAALGVAFLGLKAYEYRSEYRDGLLPLPGAHTDFASPGEHLFMNIYLIATSLHALHLTIGIVVLCLFAWLVRSRRLSLPAGATATETAATYWHLVDIIWIFLFPVLYLAR
ncbi:MAG: cytochrome c oxidase subunit 3 [Martelella sp.]|uniref:cytochrome c oxidase subunit 3 n=1 Tax=Martelella sp. TaxID=1969699 RepID=UPI0032426CFB